MTLKTIFTTLIIATIFPLSNIYAQEKQISNEIETPQVSVIVEHKQTDPSCSIQNCHGLEITCGANAPGICDAMYAIGDFCRQYAECRAIDEKCQVVTNETFDSCKNCVEGCKQLSTKEPTEIFNCELKCREELKQ